ncbi:hypothetical protein X566_16850 [Afipia sp. P52-10]|jgi:glycopeptide antibiotics resistance protein|uniref:VanZ family protein n=1 Tax=Afipia sp. P52-10 TaxID=1429916 RepID=UPI0003DF0BC3|nr:VanZ family protein [Afipia sp. P52-10]ETR76235.1 hypothetical protein X566_16850 [Afipia sp. P52-10]
MNPTIFRILAWTSLAMIAFATLSPIELRPESGMPPNIERFFAFAAIGLVFAAAYPRHFWLTLIIVLGAAFLLEILQIASPSRHGRLFDAVVKMSGGTLGLILGWLLQRFSLQR